MVNQETRMFLSEPCKNITPALILMSKADDAFYFQIESLNPTQCSRNTTNNQKPFDQKEKQLICIFSDFYWGGSGGADKNEPIVSSSASLSSPLLLTVPLTRFYVASIHKFLPFPTSHILQPCIPGPTGLLFSFLSKGCTFLPPLSLWHTLFWRTPMSASSSSLLPF